VRASVKNHFCPVQKIFASLRPCAFALKNTPAGYEPEMPLRTELENLFRLGRQIFRAYGAAAGTVAVRDAATRSGKPAANKWNALGRLDVAAVGDGRAPGKWNRRVKAQGLSVIRG
jgi:hypothetical protein